MMSKILSLVMLVFLSAPAFAGDTLYKASIVAAVAAHGADLGITENCLGTGRCKEMNPLLGRFDNPAAFGAVKMGTAAAGILLVHKMHKTHPKWATTFNFMVAAAYAGVTAHNLSIAYGKVF